MCIYAVVGAISLPWFAGGATGMSALVLGVILGCMLAAFKVVRVTEGGAGRIAAATLAHPIVWRVLGDRSV